MTADEIAKAKGQRARIELEQTEEAFAKLRAAILESIATTPPGQPEKILKLHMAVQNLAGVRQALMDMVNNGQVAEAALATAGLTRPV